MSTPTILWRLFNDRREHARAVILPGGPPHTLTFFVNDAMDRAENYETMDLALFRAGDVRRSWWRMDGAMDDVRRGRRVHRRAALPRRDHQHRCTPAGTERVEVRGSDLIFLRQIDDFVASVLDGAPPIVSLAESRRCATALSALYASARADNLKHI